MQQLPDNLFYEVQQIVCTTLNNNATLSAVNFLPENDKDIETEIATALKKQGVCGIVMVNDATFAGFNPTVSNDISVVNTAWNIDDLTIQVVENPIVNRNNLNRHYAGTASDIAYKASQILGGWGNHGTFNLKSYTIGEEDGLIVAKISLQSLITTNLSS